MGDKVVSIMVAIIGIAILSVVVSKRSNTASFIREFGNVFSGLVATVTSPIR
jgi:hypothetical protein